ncbi:MAG: hypothetical protein KGJ89_02670 [Patescibacteria group bacterium]|nr:hypothetical protein [Patescibacteria group bacterium]MDE2015782.1 hypothetical protein [Patescibacteria group bacterium]MDE2226839.1 hypothetical protein [Patescibacteria group bacterium]
MSFGFFFNEQAYFPHTCFFVDGTRIWFKNVFLPTSKPVDVSKDISTIMLLDYVVLVCFMFFTIPIITTIMEGDVCP